MTFNEHTYSLVAHERLEQYRHEAKMQAQVKAGIARRTQTVRNNTPIDTIVSTAQHLCLAILNLK